MIYLERIALGNSKKRNLHCILNWKLKPQLCKNLGRCSFLHIMNISLQNSRVQCFTYFCCCCCTQNFALCCTVGLLFNKISNPLRKYILYQISLNSSLYVMFPLLQWMFYNTVLGLLYNLIWYIKLNVYYIYYTSWTKGLLF